MPDDGGGVNRFLPVGDGGEVEDRVILDRGVEPGVIAERSFRPGLAGLDVAFEDEVDVGGDFEVVGEALHQLDGFLAQETGEEDLVEPIGEGSGRGKGVGRVAADRDRDGHALAPLVVELAMARADFVHLPMHAGGAAVVDLHAVHAEVARAGLGVAGVDVRQRDEAAAVLRPALQDRQVA